jgi:hypothetical protein
MKLQRATLSDVCATPTGSATPTASAPRTTIVPSCASDWSSTRSNDTLAAVRSRKATTRTMKTLQPSPANILRTGLAISVVSFRGEGPSKLARGLTGGRRRATPGICHQSSSNLIMRLGPKSMPLAEERASDRRWRHLDRSRLPAWKVRNVCSRLMPDSKDAMMPLPETERTIFLSDRAIGHREVCRFVLMEPRGDEKPHSHTAEARCRHFADIFASSRPPSALYFPSSDRRRRSWAVRSGGSHDSLMVCSVVYCR